MGYPTDIVISSTPHDDKINTPPQGFTVRSRVEASRLIPFLGISFMSPATPGMFLLWATKRFGRLQGSFVSMTTIPTDDEDLPQVVIDLGDSGVGVRDLTSPTYGRTDPAPGPLNFLVIGQPYNPLRTNWENIGVDYNFRSGQHELRIFLAHARPEEIAAIDSGPVEFGLLAEPSGLGLFLVTRCKTAWFDCSYSWHRVAPEERTVPPLPEETSPELRAWLHIILVEATTGIIIALRVVMFSPEFTRALHYAIARQAAEPDRPDLHAAWSNKMTQFSTYQLWEQCSIRCQGNNV
jgi:hypothetical protein